MKWRTVRETESFLTDTQMLMQSSDFNCIERRILRSYVLEFAIPNTKLEDITEAMIKAAEQTIFRIYSYVTQCIGIKRPDNTYSRYKIWVRGKNSKQLLNKCIDIVYQYKLLSGLNFFMHETSAPLKRIGNFTKSLEKTTKFINARIPKGNKVTSGTQILSKIISTTTTTTTEATITISPNDTLLSTNVSSSIDNNNNISNMLIDSSNINTTACTSVNNNTTTSPHNIVDTILPDTTAHDNLYCTKDSAWKNDECNHLFNVVQAYQAKNIGKQISWTEIQSEFGTVYPNRSSKAIKRCYFRNQKAKAKANTNTTTTGITEINNHDNNVNSNVYNDNNNNNNDTDILAAIRYINDSNSDNNINNINDNNNENGNNNNNNINNNTDINNNNNNDNIQLPRPNPRTPFSLLLKELWNPPKMIELIGVEVVWINIINFVDKNLTKTNTQKCTREQWIN